MDWQWYVSRMNQRIWNKSKSRTRQRWSIYGSIWTFQMVRAQGNVCMYWIDWLMAIFKGYSRIASAERCGKWLDGKATFLIRLKDNSKLILPSIVARWMNSSHTITIPCYHTTFAFFKSYKGRIGIRYCRELLFTDMEKREDCRWSTRRGDAGDKDEETVKQN